MQLYLPPQRPERNKKGQFIKGLALTTKGKMQRNMFRQNPLKEC